MVITVCFGTGNFVKFSCSNDTTMEQVLTDPEVKDNLGFSDNVDGQIDNVTQPHDLVLTDGQIINVVTRGCGKSARIRLVGDGPYQFYFKQIEPLVGEPFHIHVWRDGYETKFWLDPIEHDGMKTRFSKSDLRKIERIIKYPGNVEIIRCEWNSIVEQTKRFQNPPRIIRNPASMRDSR